MINTLYPIFQYWSKKGSVYIISDTHFDDFDCKYMDPAWPSPFCYLKRLLSDTKMSKQDTLIHLGDVGNPKWLSEIPCGHKVLITGNHDVRSKVASYFDEVYTGPLFISDKILLSHEPIEGLEEFVFNIHGHDHAAENFRKNHLNLAANVYKYRAFNLGKAIKAGLLSNVKNYHRVTIDAASKK